MKRTMRRGDVAGAGCLTASNKVRTRPCTSSMVAHTEARPWRPALDHAAYTLATNLLRKRSVTGFHDTSSSTPRLTEREAWDGSAKFAKLWLLIANCSARVGEEGGQVRRGGAGSSSCFTSSAGTTFSSSSKLIAGSASVWLDVAEAILLGDRLAS